MLVTDIVKAVANSRDVDSMELEPIIENHINLDAVNQLAKHDDSTWTLTFELPKDTVTVTSDGEILVDGHPENEWISA